MTRMIYLAVLLAALGVRAEAATGTAIGDSVPHVAVPGHDSAKLKTPVVYAFLGTSCPTTAKYLGRLAALEKEFRGRVAFIYFYPNRNDTPEAKRAFHEKNGFQGLLVDDPGAKLSTMLGAQKTSEVMVISKKGRIVYRGAIDDNKEEAQVKRRHLSIALKEVLAGKKVGTPKTDVFA
jgi:peroxiredoxin